MYDVVARWRQWEVVGEGRQKDMRRRVMKTLFRFAALELKKACRSRPSRYFTVSRVEVPSRRSPYLCVDRGHGTGTKSIDE